MIILAAFVLAALGSDPHTPTGVPPGDSISVVVLDPALTPQPGVTVSLQGAAASADTFSAAPTIQRITDPDGQVRFNRPPVGTYTLRLTISGFLTTTVGPFRICARNEASCCPTLVSPLRLILPLASCPGSSQVIP